MIAPTIHSFLFFSVSVLACNFFFSVLSIFCSIDFSFSTSVSGLIHQPTRRIRPTRTRKCAVHLHSEAATAHTSDTLPSTFQTTTTKNPRNCFELKSDSKACTDVGSDYAQVTRNKNHGNLPFDGTTCLRDAKNRTM